MRKRRTGIRRWPALVGSIAAVAVLVVTGHPAVADPAPVIDSYDASGTVRGHGFLPSHRVWIRIAVTGSVPTCGTNTISDLRSNFPLEQATSDGSGNLNATANAKSLLPPLMVCDNPVVYLTGAYPGERVSVSAHDERHDGTNNLIWSNTFTITAQ